MITISYSLILTVIIFVLGLIGVIFNRNIFFILLGIEIMINASALAFIIVGNYWHQVDGQIMYILIISFAAAESSICLAMLLRLYRYYKTLNIDIINEMHG